jgi:outer membrane protein assembly factor BamB
MRQAVLLTVVFVASAGTASPQGDEPGSPGFEIDLKGGKIVRRDPGGRIRWSTRLRGDLGGPRVPPPVWDAKQVYVRHNDGVTALSATTGIMLWHSEGPKDHLLASRGLLLAAEHADDSRWLTGRTVLTGAEVFRFRLPAEVVAGLPQGEDHVFLKEREVVRLSPGGKPRWTTALECHPAAEGGVVEVGGDLVAFLYCGIADSGVQVVRLNAATGKVAWRAQCDHLGVEHSKYRHEAAVVVEGDRLRVTSVGSSGTFVEVLDLRSGKQLQRKRFDP